MWTVNINEREDGAYDVTATYTPASGVSFSYSSTIKKADAAAFISRCKTLLTSFQTRQSAIATAKAQMEAALNS